MNIPHKKAEIWKKEGFEIFIIASDGEIKLNSVGSLIWQAIDGKNNISDIIDLVKEKYPNIDLKVISRDVIKFLNNFVEQDLIVIDWNPLA